jgi:hypothetical protein
VFCLDTQEAGRSHVAGSEVSITGIAKKILKKTLARNWHSLFHVLKSCNETETASISCARILRVASKRIWRNVYDIVYGSNVKLGSIQGFWTLHGLRMKPGFLWVATQTRKTLVYGQKKPHMKFIRSLYIRRKLVCGEPCPVDELSILFLR